MYASNIILEYNYGVAAAASSDGPRGAAIDRTQPWEIR